MRLYLDGWNDHNIACSDLPLFTVDNGLCSTSREDQGLIYRMRLYKIIEMRIH